MEVLPDLSAADAHRIIRFGTIAGLVAALIAFVVVQESAPAVMAPTAATSLENTTNQAIVDRAPETVGPVGPGARAPTGNPLWAAPLELLSATRERPLFSPSRRPPQPPVVIAPQIPPVNPPKPAEPDYPLLVLMGTIVGEAGGIGIFLDRTASEIIRLKTGENHAGWILRTVTARDARFEKDGQTAMLALPDHRAELEGQSAWRRASSMISTSRPELR